MIYPELPASPSPICGGTPGILSLASGLLENVLTSIGLDNAPPLICVPAVSCGLRMPNLDPCCINTPSGHFLATQFWDTHPALGANDTWTIHGLWPDHCNGGFDAFCNSSRALSGAEIRQIIADADANGTHPGLHDYMNQYWQSTFNDASSLWSHEWNKHGTCISTIETACYDRDQQRPDPPETVDAIDVLDYFTHASMLFSTLPTFQFFADHDIVPSYEKTYTLEQLQAAIRASSHGNEATIHCRNHNEISEIWYHFNVRGSLRHAMDNWWNGNQMWNSWVPTWPDGQKCRCPAEGIRYLPKGEPKHPVPPSPTHTVPHTSGSMPTSTATSTPTPFVSKGRLMVKVLPDSDSETLTDHAPTLPELHDDTDFKQSTAPIPHPYTGCLIRHGTWYHATSLSSCAIFTADDDVKSSDSASPLPALTSSLSQDDDTNYHLFTLASRYAPCSFIPSHVVSSAYFACTPDLGFQSILSNNATIDRQHTEDARRLTVGTEHTSVFYAASMPSKNQKEVLWMDLVDGDDVDAVAAKRVVTGEIEKKVRVELYWLAV